MPRVPVRILAIVIFVLSAESCSSRAMTRPVEWSVRDFRLHMEPDSAQLTIGGASGEPLLEGIPTSSDVGVAQSSNDDAPPLTGFAVREVASTYEMLFGAFKVVDDTSKPWRVATRAQRAKSDD